MKPNEPKKMPASTPTLVQTPSSIPDPEQIKQELTNDQTRKNNGWTYASHTGTGRGVFYEHEQRGLTASYRPEFKSVGGVYNLLR